MRRCVVLVLLLVSWMVGQRINAQTVPDSSANSGSSTNSNSAGVPEPAGNNDSLDWLFPITKLNQSLPGWFRIGGEFRRPRDVAPVPRRAISNFLVAYSAQNTQLSHRALDWKPTCFMRLHQGERACKRLRHTREANRASTSAAATA
jgi:hypothetical protein